MELDGGLRAVTLVPGDAEAVTELVRACELEDGGIAERTLEDTLTVIGRPSFSLADSAIGVRDGDALVATPRSRGAARPTRSCCPPTAVGASAPRWCGGRGTQPARWGSPRSASRCTSGPRRRSRCCARTATTLAARRGSSRSRSTRRRRRPPCRTAMRCATFVPGRDDRAAYQVIEDAFSEWPGRDPEPYGDWIAETLGRPGSAPSSSCSRCGATEVVGALGAGRRRRRGASSTSSRSRASTAAAAWRARCSSGPSRSRASAGGPRACCRRTRGRARSGSTSTSGMTPRGTYLHLERPLR